MSSSGSLSNGSTSPGPVGCVEHGQTLIIDDNLSQHRRIEQRNKKRGILKKSSSFSESTPLMRRSSSVPSILEVKEYGARSQDKIRTIRFQVVVWYVGQVDVVQGKVPMTFRLSIFWNTDDEEDDLDGDGDSMSASSRSRTTWSMHGRQQAFEKEIKDIPIKAVNVPPVSILNVVTFDTIGAPEVSMLREDTKLMRWTCMYRATLIQEDMSVRSFPHDIHNITLKLAILAHRGKGRQWDRDVWKIALATEDDSQGSTEVPYGLVVAQVKVPQFELNRNGVSFDIVPLEHGPAGGNSKDQCLEVKIPVLRESGYYDSNIMPILGLLNLVAVSIVCLEPENFFQRGLLTLQIAFVAMGIRMTTDSHLPSVAYQIKMQRILNEYFFGLLFLVLESIMVYELYMHFGWTHEQCDVIDWTAAILSLAHNARTQFFYYREARRAKQEIRQMRVPKDTYMNSV